MIKHNKLSVEPMLYIKSTTLHSVSELEIKLMNGGLGTGIINSIEILYKEERYKSFQFMLDKNMVIQKDKFLFASLGESSLISSNSELPLLRYKAITKDELKSLISILNDIDIKIEYESMYGDKKTI